MQSFEKSLTLFYRILLTALLALTPLVFFYNTQIFSLLNCSRNETALHLFFLILTSLADGLWIVMIATVVQSLYPRNFWAFVLALVIGNILLQTGKFGVDALRPVRVLGDAAVCVLGQRLTVRSFPSGHSFSVAVLLMFLLPRRSLAMALLAVLLAATAALSRVYVGAHFPRDVVAGFLIGIFSYWLAEKLLRRFSLSETPTLKSQAFTTFVGLTTALAYIFLYHEKTETLEFLLTPLAWALVTYWVVYLVALRGFLPPKK